MPNIKSAIKRARTNEKRRALRASQKSALRSKIRAYEETIQNVSGEEAQTAFSEVQRSLDKAVSKGLLHRNAAARKKTQLAKKRQQAQS